jgi:hypothetical protein
MTYLNFSKNEITDLGLKFIIEMLKENSSVNVLFLHYNRILGKGGALLAKHLVTNKTL